MNMDFQLLLIGIGIAVLLLVIRYIIRFVFGKAEDAVNNKMNDRKSKRQPSGTENYRTDTNEGDGV